jgi:hypothetical protein
VGLARREGAPPAGEGERVDFLFLFASFTDAGLPSWAFLCSYMASLLAREVVSFFFYKKASAERAPRPTLTLTLLLLKPPLGPGFWLLFTGY